MKPRLAILIVRLLIPAVVACWIMTIAVSRPGHRELSRVLVIRHAGWLTTRCSSCVIRSADPATDRAILRSAYSAERHGFDPDSTA
jgi:hypothetical protein